MKQEEIDQLEYETMKNRIGFYNEQEEIEEILERVKKNIEPTEFEDYYDDLYPSYTSIKEFQKEIKEKKFTKEELACLYHCEILNCLRYELPKEREIHSFIEKAMQYDENHHYNLDMIPLIYDFYNGKDEAVKEKLNALPENALTILLKGYYSNEDGKTIMDRIYDYDPVSYVVFSIPEIQKYLRVEETHILSLNKSFDSKDYFLQANTFKYLLNLYQTVKKEDGSPFKRYKALMDIMKQATPFEERLSKDLMSLVRFEIGDVVGLMESKDPLFDSYGRSEDLLDTLNELEMMDRQITEEEFVEIIKEAERMHLVFFDDVDNEPLMKKWYRFPTFIMVVLEKYISSKDREKEIFANIKPGQVPYFKISFALKYPKNAIKRQFLVRYDTSLYDVCHEFLYSIGADTIEHQAGFETEKTSYDCTFSPFCKDDFSEYVDSKDVRPYQMDSDTAIFTYDFTQNWDFIMKISHNSYSKKDCGPCVLQKATGYQIFEGDHYAFAEFYYGQKISSDYNACRRFNGGKILSREEFFGFFNPEDVAYVSSTYPECEEDEYDEESEDEEKEE